MTAAIVRKRALKEDGTPPPDLLAFAEAPRMLVELALFYAVRPALSFLPRGDGHTVMVVPGFMANDSSTAPIRSLLSDLGYDVVGWELGRNVTFTEARIDALRGGLRRVHQRSGRKVSIVGWSLGGILARQMALRHPELVRQVITLGSPLNSQHSHANVMRVFEAFNGKDAASRIKPSFRDMVAPPPVPSSSIFTRSDGIVAWRGSVQPETSISENIEVLASHCGLGVNPTVMVAIADRLAQPEGEWRKFKPTGMVGLLFPPKRTT
jgi:pimeloyl-ACP methyl ester carboxylesterase